MQTIRTASKRQQAEYFISKLVYILKNNNNPHEINTLYSIALGSNRHLWPAVVDSSEASQCIELFRLACEKQFPPIIKLLRQIRVIQTAFQCANKENLLQLAKLAFNSGNSEITTEIVQLMCHNNTVREFIKKQLENRLGIDLPETAEGLGRVFIGYLSTIFQPNIRQKVLKQLKDYLEKTQLERIKEINSQEDALNNFNPYHSLINNTNNGYPSASPCKKAHHEELFSSVFGPAKTGLLDNNDLELIHSTKTNLTNKKQGEKKTKEQNQEKKQTSFFGRFFIPPPCPPYQVQKIFEYCPNKKTYQEVYDAQSPQLPHHSN